MSFPSPVTPVSPVMPSCAPASPPSSPAAPRLGVALRADFEALQNDFEQATELAADFQRQLSGKSNEYAALKHVFEKTSLNLTRLQTDIEELREERHRLANEAMRAESFQFQLGKAIQERDELKKEITTQESVVAKQEARIVQLTSELEWTRKNIPILPGSAKEPQNPNDLVTKAILEELMQKVDQLRELIEKPPAEKIPAKESGARSKKSTPAPATGDDFIDISFNT